MTSKLTSKLYAFLFITFVLWYVLRRTSLGKAYSTDMLAIPQQVLGVGEGLSSAILPDRR